MARGRMLNKKISEDIQFNTMLPDDTCRLMATWIIAHLDYNGVFYAEPIVVKSIVLPWRADVTIEQVEHYLLLMEQAGLIVIFKAKGQKWQWWRNFKKNQTGLRPEKEKTDYPDPALYIDIPTDDKTIAETGQQDDDNYPDTNEEGEGIQEEPFRKNSGKIPENIPPNRSLNESESESTPNGVGEKSPEAPPDSKPETLPDEKPDGKKALMGTFLTETRLTMPRKKNTVGFWWSSVGEIYEMTNRDIDIGQRIIRQAVKALKDKQLTIGGPESIIKTCRALAAGQTIGDRQNGHHKNTATNQTSISGLREKGSDNPVKKRFNPTTGETYWVDIRTNQRVPAPDSA